MDEFRDLEYRKQNGEYYTPADVVDEVHKMISSELGENWKDEYVVWDCCAGLGALTRDYTFKELYCSTLEQEDIDILKSIPNESTIFQFDFLNDDIFDNMLFDEASKVPQQLQEALQSKKVLFLVNPPYKTASNISTIDSTGVANTSINTRMKDDGWGKSSGQLYAQFMYRMWNLNKSKNITVCLLTQPLYKSGSSYKEFRKKWYSKFEMMNSFIFPGGYFKDTSSLWGCDFSIWKSGVEKRTDSLPSIIKVRECDAEKTIAKLNKIQYRKNLSKDERKALYSQYEKDSIVYSLFNNSSQQSSLRNIDYKDKKWDIKNEWFWLSKQTMIDLAKDIGWDEMVDDAEASEERFVWAKVGEVYNDLSDDTKDVLDTFSELLRLSMKERKIMSDEHPEYHLQTWDAGYAQIKLVLKDYYPEEFKEFRNKYKALEDRLIPIVYELGFLK